MSNPVLSIAGLSAVSERDGGAPILRDVSLTLGHGEVLGLVGESGAGKSTIAKAVLGMLPRTVKIVSGTTSFEGQDLLRLPAGRLRAIMGSEITLIPQDPMTALNPGRRIEDQLTDGLRLRRGLPRTAARERAMALLDEVQIREPERVMRAYPHELSGGMRQRVLIASAFAMQPKLVIADEPTTALDVTVQKQILRLIRQMQVKHGTSVIFVTHDLGVVAQICDRVVLLYGGMVVEAGTTTEIFNAPIHAYTKALLAAGPRYDRPQQALEPVPDAVFTQLRGELVAFDREAPRHG